MKKQKGMLLFLSTLLLVLAILPYGAVLPLANAPGAGRGADREIHFGFSLLSFGHADFFPRIIALLSCVLVGLVLLYVWKNKALGAIQAVSMTLVLLSFSPIVLGVAYASAVGAAIAVLAFAQAAWAFAIGQRAK